jgi:glycosyltransferase involved in cell wall biosynthesis
MEQKGNVIVSVTNDLVTDNRVSKVCNFLISEGYSVTLIGRKLKSSFPISERRYKTKRLLLLFTKGPLFYLEFNIRLFLYLLFQRPKLLVSNDLDTLLANYLASKCKAVKLVYDTHEYFTEVPELVENPTKQKIWLRLEKWIFPKLKNIYTVNDSIAKIYSEKYGVPVHVVRNVAPTFEFTEKKSRTDLGLPLDKFILLIQGSGINRRRGAEEAVEAMKKIENTLLLIIGSGDVLDELKLKVKEQQLIEKVIFLSKMSYAEMMSYTMNADLGLAIDHTDILNHKLALPNKFFDYIQAEIPILATEISEIEKIIEKYKIGFVLKEELTPHSLAEKINQIKDLKLIEKSALKENLKKAKSIENWDNELNKLKEIYSNLN